VAEGQRHAARSLSALAQCGRAARGRWRRPMGSWTGKCQRPCANVDNARSLVEFRRATRHWLFPGMNRTGGSLDGGYFVCLFKLSCRRNSGCRPVIDRLHLSHVLNQTSSWVHGLDRRSKGRDVRGVVLARIKRLERDGRCIARRRRRFGTAHTSGRGLAHLFHTARPGRSSCCLLAVRNGPGKPTSSVRKYWPVWSMERSDRE
jgi:hypothetical protein